MNKVMLIGNLTKDPEVRTTVTGKTVCDFTLAVGRNYSPNGEKKTDFFRCLAWGEMGKACGKYLYKGAKAGVTGRLEPYTYTRNDGGQGMNLNVQCDEVEFLTRKQDREQPPEQEQPHGGTEAFTDVSADDIPF